MRFAKASFVFLSAVLLAEEPPADLVRRVALREAASEGERANYAYRQRVLIEELDKRGIKAGEYREARDIVFSPDRERSEQMIGKPALSLVRLKLTEEDFRDIREIQPLLLTPDRLRLYGVKYRGVERTQDRDCWVLEVKPRQILSGQRPFEGLLWIDPADFSIIETEGRAVPQIMTTKEENLFPSFRTTRRRGPSGHWFPATTFADDVLPFRTGPLRLRMRIEYSEYKRFGAESTIRFDESR
jgi:hypothetical protein